MTMLKLFGIVFFCGLLSPSQEVLSGLSCAVSAGAMQNVLSDAILQNGLLQQHLQGLVLPNILGEGGLLNSPTSITGLHLVKVWLPKLSVVLLPGIGVQLTIAAKLELSGNCLVGLLSELIDILVDVNITANIKCTNFESGTVQVVIEDCLCILGAIKIKLLSGSSGAAGGRRGGAEPLCFCCVLQLCPVVDIVVNLVNIQLLGTLNGAFLGGDEGIWASLAALAGQFNVRVSSLQGAVKQVGGSIIPHDSSPSALPPLLDRLLVLGLRQSFLNAVLSLLIQIPPQTFPCTSEAFSGASHLQEAITTLIPAGCSACPGTSPLSIRLALSGNPLILLEENKATVELSVVIQVFVKSLDGSILNLLLLKADLALNARVSIAGGRLVLGLSLGSLKCLILDMSDKGVKESTVINASQGMIKDWKAFLIV
uniref:Lipid-binding serum glycoprotein N-terminal domain-containing protein n=1 Tax=Strix occidentalis caurina TaxID=311401 RepID=A0A8D0KVR7_STROC